MKYVVDNESIQMGHWISCFGIFPIVYKWGCGFCSCVDEGLFLLECATASVGKCISKFWEHYFLLKWWNLIIHWHSTIFCLFVYSFIHSVTYVTLDTSITDYNLYITTQLIIYGHPHNTDIINNNKKFKDQLGVEFVTTFRYIYVCVCSYINITKS